MAGAVIWQSEPGQAAGGLQLDKLVSGHATIQSTSVTSPAFTTSQPGELLVAFLESDGPASAQTFSSVTGGGLTWRLRQRTNAQRGTSEIWQAVATGVVTNATVRGTHSDSYYASITVATFTGANTTIDGATRGANAVTGAPTVTLTTTRPGSWVWGAGNDYDRAIARTVGSNQTKVDEYLAPSGDTFWVQRQNAVTPTPDPVTINDTAPTTDRWNLSAIEIPAADTAAPDTTPPTVNVTAPANGATVAGTVNVTAAASDNVGVLGVRLTLDGANLAPEDTAAPYAATWDTTTAGNGSHTISAIARDAAGNTATGSVTVTVNNGSSDPSVVGAWGPVVAWPEVSIHAALTYTGKVLTFQGDFSQGGQQYLLDPATGTPTQVPNALADLFCAGQAVLADGRILVIGGTATSGGLGIRDITAFNPATETWQVMASMHYPRWYPTGTTLRDGRVLVTSGSDNTLGDIVQIPEIYDTQHNTWTDLTAATHNIPFYPFMYQLPDGRVLWAGASEEATPTEVLSANLQSWTSIDSRIIDGATITNYAPGKFMKAGSASDSGFTGPSSATAFTLDMNQPNPTWQPTASMAFPRSFVNLTNLPDGTVLATGGGTDKSGYNEANAVKPAEIWDPATGTWRTVAAMATPRLYHSVAVLLPDGRVFVSGSGGDAGVTDERNYEIYSPNYLSKGPRPSITSAPGTVQYNSTAFVQTPNAANIQKVTLIRTGSVTHSFDQNARALQLSFTQSAGGLNVQMPQSGNYAPPGYYLLSIVDGNGVPSVSKYVRFPAPFEDSVAPSAPTNLTATGRVGKVDLAWGASTDNIGVAKYDVYRSTTPGFTPSPANQVAQVGGGTLSYSDSGLAAGTYYYQVKAEDAAANLGPSSNEAIGTAAPDTTPPTAPANLTATPATGQVALSWTAATDNVGVTRYNILRDGAPVGTATGTSFTDGSVVAGTTYGYTVTAQDAAGNVSVPSNLATATVPSGSPVISVDASVTTHQGTAGTTISAPALTTTQSNELLLAFLSSDGPSGSGSISFSSVSGGGLTWTLRKRQNTQAGTAEIWQAVAPGPLAGVTVTATRSSGSWQGSITVAAFKNADTVLGATGGASAGSGAPTATLTTTRAGSWVWAAGTDWSNPIARTVGANQTLVDQFLAPAGDAYWVQRQNAQSPASGTLVTINDTAPTADQYNLALIEILAK
ncbi:MAG TPA: galactose oxidase-like domain-containing protein [Actinomycetes bacterium]|nr:galactose oxidase-like domain-containing protein [Actinomycetes bacterium]